MEIKEREQDGAPNHQPKQTITRTIDEEWSAFSSMVGYYGDQCCPEQVKNKTNAPLNIGGLEWR